ncbi:unnamed protein product [Protopolystoma xenopodis]|uniref:Uncharacterized protein n=1 Tax=Protopolystoma xenopodis TaxID=117903 RepID=A0A3S5C4M7_9PLAT|nr:unnamed protein product [Protopolystoma xenopodis]
MSKNGLMSVVGCTTFRIRCLQRKHTPERLGLSTWHIEPGCHGEASPMLAQHCGLTQARQHARDTRFCRCLSWSFIFSDPLLIHNR